MPDPRTHIEPVVPPGDTIPWTALANAIDDVVAVVDLDHRYVCINGAGTRFMGRAVEELIGRPISEGLPPEVGRELDVAIDEAIALGAPGRSEQVVELDGVRTVWQTSFGPLRDAAGEVVAIVGIARDITGAKDVELLLERNEALLAAAERMAHLGSFEVDLQTNAVRWSDNLMALTGVDQSHQRRSLMPQAMSELVHPDDLGHVRAAIQDALSRDRLDSFEFRLVHPDTGYRVMTCITRVDRVGGRPVRLYGVVQDVTGARELQDQFRHAQKMEAVGRLAGGIAHDFNNALTAILGYSQMLRRRLHGRPEAKWADQIEASARDAANLTRQMLAFSRQQDLRPEIIDLVVFLQDLGPLVRRLLGAAIELSIGGQPGQGFVRADPGQLQQVVFNIVTNARDAMGDAGRLDVAAHPVTVNAAEAAALGVPAGRYVQLSIADTGPGMRPETQAHIFEPFFTTKEVGKGTGLGLAMVHGVITQSGGTITFQSHPSQGTVFRILLPSVGQPGREPRTTAPPPSPKRNARVLVVDDEAVIRELTRLTLESHGYQVIEAGSGREGLQALEEEGPFDLVISDLVMPGLGGLAVAEAASAGRRGSPVILMSGHHQDQAHGDPHPYLVKPFTPSQLLATVRKSLATSAPVPARRSSSRRAPAGRRASR